MYYSPIKTGDFQRYDLKFKFLVLRIEIKISNKNYLIRHCSKAVSTMEKLGVCLR